MRTQTTRTIAGRVNIDGTPKGGGFTSRKIATGGYVITFPGRGISAVASPDGSGFALVWNWISADSVQINTQNVAGAQADQGFDFVVTVAA